MARGHRLGVMVGVILVLALSMAPSAPANGQSLSGDWNAKVKCEGLEGPSVAMPGAKLKLEGDHRLLIAQGTASATQALGSLGSKSLDVLMFRAGEYDPVAAWCGWMNTSYPDGRKGQGSLGDFARIRPISLSHLFYVTPPPPFGPWTVLDYGDSTMHIKKWELTNPDSQGCDAKLEMDGSLWVPGGATPLGGGGAAWGGTTVFASCHITAKRCPSAVTPIAFCQHPGFLTIGPPPP